MAMTPTQIIDLARKRYNAVGDNFFSDSELLDLIWDAQMQLALEAKCIKTVYTANTVANQQEYTLASNVLGIFRATYDSEEMEVVSLHKVLRQTEGLSIGSGFSDSVAHWDNTIYLAPIPDAASIEIKLWCYIEPSAVTSSSSLEVPARHQFKIVQYLIAHMAYKDNNERLGDRYMKKWEEMVEKANRQEREFERTGGLNTVQNEDNLYGVE